jgi:uracil-DNA glycosylase family protein
MAEDNEPYYSLAEPPKTADLREVAEAAKGCRACHLWRHATQVVFGEGNRKARVMLVGEQPGDQEDKQGHPFVGPAGKLLDAALEEAGIDPAVIYTTNAVKHFKWEARGARRLHKKPNGREILACRPWLETEIQLVEPEVIVCLGATAAQALLGKDFKVTERRGEFLPGPLGRTYFATVHPSSILRAFDDETRHRERARFVEDLKQVAHYLAVSIASRASLR